MYILKGFYSFAPLIDNQRDQVARFGELSAHSATFAKDKTQYTNTVAPQTTLISFHSVRDDTPVEVPHDAALDVLKVGQYIYNRSIGGQLTDDATAFRQALLSEFNEIVRDFSHGELVHDGLRWMPEWVQFHHARLGEENRLTLWLSDEAFRRQYDTYHVEVIPPVADLDLFFRDPLVVKQALDAYDPTAMLDQVQTIRGEYPYTRVRAMRYDYRDAEGSGIVIPTYWTVMIYGEAGNNPDLIRQAIADYVLEHSEHPEEDWSEILPEIFIATEFILTPFWHRYSIPNRELQAGMYSPLIRMDDLFLTQLTVQGSAYTEQWISEQVELGTLMYKSLAFAVVGNPRNIDGVTAFSEKFPDYFLVGNQSADYNRMTPYTQEFLDLLNDMTVLAEGLTEESAVPAGMGKVVRNGILYISAIYDRVTYLIVSKKSIEDLTTSPPR